MVRVSLGRDSGFPGTGFHYDFLIRTTGKLYMLYDWYMECLYLRLWELTLFELSLEGLILSFEIVDEI